MSSLSRNFIEQKQQMETLAAALDTLIQSSLPLTYHSTILPNQRSLEGWWVAQGRSLPIPPQVDIFWFDAGTLRGQYATMKDYFTPIHAQQPWTTLNGTDRRDTDGGLWALDATHFIVSGADSVAVDRFRSGLLYLDKTTTSIGPSTFDGHGATGYVDPVNRELLIYTSAFTVVKCQLSNPSSTINLGITDAFSALPAPQYMYPVFQRSSDKLIYYINTSKQLRQRTDAGVHSTLVNLGTVSSDFPFRLEYDAVSDKILVFFRADNGHTSVYRLNADGSGATAMVSLQAFGGGWTESVRINTNNAYQFRFFGAEVRAGKLYVPETGMTYLNVNRRRRIDIATNTYETTETFDFGAAYAYLKEPVRQATEIRELDRIDLLDPTIAGLTSASGTTGNHRTNKSRTWGVDHYSGLLTKLIDIQRLPSNDGWLLKYWNTWGPGPTLDASHVLGNYYAAGVLPDSGSSGRIYAVTQYGNGLPDVVRLKSYVAETSVNTVTLDWSEFSTMLEDFDRIEISFDSGLSVADTISVRFNDVAAGYTSSYHRLSAATNSYVNNAAASAIIVPSSAQGATTGGRYKISGPRVHAASTLEIEGFLTSGVTTTLTNSVLGAISSPITGAVISVTFFTTGGTAQWTAGAQFEIVAYRTKGPKYRNGVKFDGPLVS